MHRLLVADEMDLILDDLTGAMGSHFQISTCQNGIDLVQAIDTFAPELMVLDLSMPNYDPFRLLKTIKDRHILIIATAWSENDYLVRFLEDMGVRWLMLKPVLSSVVAARLLDLELSLDDPPDRAIRSAAYNMLMQAGIPLRRQGFDFLAESIIYAAANPGCSMTDALYPHVARVYNTTTSAVDITMRRCIERAYKYKNSYNWRLLFDRTTLATCPSNSSFIKSLAHTVQKQLQNHQTV